MQRIELDNFRVYGSPVGFDLAPVTVLTGKNNSGKSSLIKAFLVLADYLEQNDQTVLRLDGKRASRHRISDWGNLRNWDSPDLDNLTLGYTQDDAHFLYEFENGGPRQPPHLYRFRMVVPGIDSMTLISTDGGNAYQLDVAQKFIDYVAGSTEQRAKMRQAAEYPQQLSLLRKELFELDTKLDVELGPDAVSAFPRLLEHRQLLEVTIKDMELLLAQAHASAGIFFQATVSVSDLTANPTISSLIQTALNRYVHENIPYDDEGEDDQDADDDLDVFDEDDEEQADRVEMAKDARRQRLQEVSEKKRTLQLSKEQGLRVLFRFSQAVEQQMKFELAHLSANRTHQARLYLTGTHYSEINTIAENFHRLGAFAEGEAEAFLVEWLPRFGIGDKVEVELVDNVAIRVTVTKDNKAINLADLGFGAGQILTVLLQIAALIQAWEAKSHEARLAAQHSPTIILIEEPEANLHPQFQSLLAELFAAVVKETKYGFHFILESHSEYFIRNIQVLVKTNGNTLTLKKLNFGRNTVTQEEKRLDLFKVYYLDIPSEANGNKHGHEMRLREDGVFMDEFGEGFLMNESANLTFKLF